MYPLYLTTEPNPIYSHIHTEIILRRNQEERIRFHNIRMVVYPHGDGNYIQMPIPQMENRLEHVEQPPVNNAIPNHVQPALNSLQNHESRPQLIRHRRSTVHVMHQTPGHLNVIPGRRVINPPRLNYRRILCMFCRQIMITNDNTVVCTKCIYRLN